MLAACLNVDAFEVGTVTSPRDAGSNTLIADFGNGTESCNECLLQRCGDHFDACSSASTCVDYATCTLENHRIGSPLDCLQDDPSLYQVAAIVDDIYSCSNECFEQCDIGDEWSCVGQFDLVATESPITITQRLRGGFGETPLPGIEVSFCTGWGTQPDCGNPSAECVSDMDGRCSVTFEIPLTPPQLSGWRGYRLVGDLPSAPPTIVPHVLVQNIPIVWSRPADPLGLLRIDEATAVLQHQVTSVELGEDAAIFGVQTLDCALIPAPKARVRVVGFPQAYIRYPSVDALGNYVAKESPDASTGGLAVIAGLPGNKAYDVESYLPNGDVVGRFDGLHVPLLSEGKLLVATMFPSPRDRDN